MNLVGTVNQKLDFITKGMAVKGTISYASSYGDPGSNNTGATNNTVLMSGGEFPSYIYDPSTQSYIARSFNTCWHLSNFE